MVTLIKVVGNWIYCWMAIGCSTYIYIDIHRGAHIYGAFFCMQWIHCWMAIELIYWFTGLFLAQKDSCTQKLTWWLLGYPLCTWAVLLRIWSLVTNVMRSGWSLLRWLYFLSLICAVANSLHGERSYSYDDDIFALRSFLDLIELLILDVASHVLVL